MEKKEKENINIFINSRKFYFDKLFISGVYEICFNVSFNEKEIDDELLKKLINDLLDIPVRIPKVFDVKSAANTEKDYSTTLRDATESLKKYYNVATFERKRYSDTKDSLEYIEAHKPNIFVKTREGDNVPISNLYDMGNGVFYHELPVGRYSVRWLHNSGEKDNNAYKQKYTSMNEIPVFRNSLNFVLKKIENEELLPEPRSKTARSLQRFLKEAITKIREKDFMSEVPEKYRCYFEEPLSNLEEIEKKLLVEMDMRKDIFQDVLGRLKEEEERKIRDEKIRIRRDKQSKNVPQSNSKGKNISFVEAIVGVLIVLVVIGAMVFVPKYLKHEFSLLDIAGIILLLIVVCSGIFVLIGKLSSKDYVKLMIDVLKAIIGLFRGTGSGSPENENPKNDDNEQINAQKKRFNNC